MTSSIPEARLRMKVQAVLDNTDVADIGTQKQANELTEEIVSALAGLLAETTSARSEIAEQVRRHCTPSSEAYTRGGDFMIRAVADWIENPPGWVQEIIEEQATRNEPAPEEIVSALVDKVEKPGNGADVIVAERLRQITVEGYTPEGDAGHAYQLVDAARCYTHAGIYRHGVPPTWPWADRYWKPSDDVKRNLTKAGALIAAAIDALEAEERNRRVVAKQLLSRKEQS